MRSIDKFQILSLDGGGIKGIFSAGILAALEEDLNINIEDHFDLIAGTSTGGLIGLALGFGIRPRKMVDFYLDHGPKIFNDWFKIKLIQHFFLRKFSPLPLEIALRQCFQSAKFGDSTKRLIIPSYCLGNDNVYLFRTPHHEKLRFDHKQDVWKVAKAACAAPTYFPCSKEINNLRLIDGGVWANNPSLVAVVEAYKTLRIPLESQYIFSIGTLQNIKTRKKRLDHGGILSCGLGNAAVDIILKAQSTAINNQILRLLSKEQVVRVDPIVPDNEFKLDKTCNANDLIAKASYFARSVSGVFKERFFEHKANDYLPYYSS
jgi:uncharacterized protein